MAKSSITLSFLIIRFIVMAAMIIGFAWSTPSISP